MSHIHKMLNRSFRYLGLTMIAALGIVSTLGTGGGGGGGDGDVLQPIIYDGNINPAVITTSNAPTLVANVLYGGSSATNIPTASLSTLSTSRFRRRM